MTVTDRFPATAVSADFTILALSKYAIIKRAKRKRIGKAKGREGI
jgi:hypothetical protein